MENKINLVELLKDCPSGMELNCTMFERVEFDGIVDNEQLPIRCRIKNPDGGYNVYKFTKHGNWIDTAFAKCVIFPKDRTTWEGFVPPCKFKDGDIISDCLFDTICIFKGEGRIKGTVDFYCGISGTDELFIKDVKDQDEHFGEIYEYKFATEEEKEKLFQAIKDNGYKWNAETKTLEKINDLKFKIGDRITNGIVAGKIRSKYIDSYQLDNDVFVFFSALEKWKLDTSKFDINSLVPFESKVLVRDSNFEKWRPATWGYYDIDSGYNYPYEVVGGHGFNMCIPYEGNSHLMGKTDDCDEFYKTW